MINDLLKTIRDAELYRLYSYIIQVVFIKIDAKNREITIKYDKEYEKFHAYIEKIQKDSNIRIISINDAESGMRKNYDFLIKNFRSKQREFILNFEIPRYIIEMLGYSCIESIDCIAG